MSKLQIPRIKETAKYMLEHKDEYEQLEYANLKNGDLTAYYRVICNGVYSYECDIEANAKEGWINVIVYNLQSKMDTPVGQQYNKYQSPYFTKIDGEIRAAYTKIYGDVVIFRLDPFTQQPIKKRQMSTTTRFSG
jgi:hypothetical protein